MKKYLTLFYLITCCAYGSSIKNLTSLNGYRDNQLVGYGIVIGLDGKGDTTITYTAQSILNTLKNFGINTGETLSSMKKPKNVASVMVTADVKAFAKNGSRMDVVVSSIGDAKSLQGGILIQTPLTGADGKVYAVAQGPVVIGGFIGGNNSASVQQNHPTVGRIVNGAIVEKEIPVNLLNNNAIELNLLNPDFVTAVRIADVINENFPGSAQAISPATVNVHLPEAYQGQLTNFVARIGNYEVVPEAKAKIIINERTGTIVATDQVRISTVAVSHGNLTITVAQKNEVSQPGGINSLGKNQRITNSNVQVQVNSKNFMMLDEFPSIQELTSALNQIGATTRDIMTILQSIKAAGALQAELVVL